VPDMNSRLKEFFSLLLQEVDINTLGCSPFVSIPSEKLYDCEQAYSFYSENPTTFLQTYQGTAASFLDEPHEGDCSNAICSAFVLLKLIDINVAFQLDRKLLSGLLIALSNKLQLLETTYENEQCGEYLRGFSVFCLINVKVLDILSCVSSRANEAEVKSFVLDAIAQVPVTNTVLAGWNFFCLKKYEKRASKKVTQVDKALYLYDHLVGEGLKNLLINQTEEQVIKRLKALDDVGLQEVSQKILAFYSCKTGNEKRRFLSCGIEDLIEYTEMIRHLNGFLVD